MVKVLIAGVLGTVVGIVVMIVVIVAAGLDCVEIGTGNYPGTAHCRPDELLADDATLQRYLGSASDAPEVPLPGRTLPKA